MSAPHKRQLKLIEFTLGIGTDTPISFECQVTTWNLQNNTDDGEKHFTFCPDGAYTEDVDPDWALTFTALSDWREDGISDFLQAHNGEVANFVLDHHPDIPAEHVQWTGQVTLKAPNVGGDARATETQEVALQCVGEPVYERVTAGAGG